MEKPRLLARAEQMGLTNVHFYGYVPKTRLPGILAACDIGLMILANVGYRPVTPNKIFEYMFAGLPSVVNFPGPTADMVLADQTGAFADPADPRRLAEHLIAWADHPEQRKTMGAHARQLAYQKYDRRTIARQLADVFQQVLDAYKTSSNPLSSRP